jgi:hypothetical protein
MTSRSQSSPSEPQTGTRTGTLNPNWNQTGTLPTHTQLEPDKLEPDKPEPKLNRNQKPEPDRHVANPRHVADPQTGTRQTGTRQARQKLGQTKLLPDRAGTRQAGTRQAGTRQARSTNRNQTGTLRATKPVPANRYQTGTLRTGHFANRTWRVVRLGRRQPGPALARERRGVSNACRTGTRQALSGTHLTETRQARFRNRNQTGTETRPARFQPKPHKTRSETRQ